MKVFYFYLLLLLISSIKTKTLYSYSQTFIEATDQLRMISISDHNEVFIASGDEKKVYVYFNQGDNFVSSHTLTIRNYDVNIADITGDGKWILSTDDSKNVRIYKFDLKTHRY